MHPTVSSTVGQVANTACLQEMEKSTLSRFFEVTCSQRGWHWVRCIDCEWVAALKVEHGEWLLLVYAVTAYNRPRSQNIDVDIIGTLMALAWTFGARAT